jgi:hypothetical protein
VLIEQMDSAIKEQTVANDEHPQKEKGPLRFKATLEHKPSEFDLQDCIVVKTIELPASEFDDLVRRPLVDRAWITENSALMYRGEDGYHCVLALGEGRSDGVLIEAEGYGYPRKAAHIPNARAALEQEQRQEMGGVKLRDLMQLGPFINTYLAHIDPEVGFVDAELLDTLTDKGREDYAELLGADVVSIRYDDGGPEIVLGGIEPQTLMDFYEAAMNHKRAEHEMGDMMP